MTAPARLSLVTLGVADVARSTAFYQSLGWTKSSASVPDEVSFFHMAGARLSLWSIKSFAASLKLDEPDPSVFRGVALAINCNDAAQVDETFATVKAGGGRTIQEPHIAPWGGYTGCFADFDGHIWEVALNPDWPIGEDDLPVLPE